MDNQIFSKIVNTCITCPQIKLEQPFKVLLTFHDAKHVLEVLIQTLSKARDVSTKQRVSSLIQTYIMRNFDKLNATDEDLVNVLQLITTETPISTEREHIEQFCKSVEFILSKIKSMPTSKIFNFIVSKPYPYSAITLSLLTKNEEKYCAPTLKYIVAVHKEPNPLSFYAASLFFEHHNPSKFTAEAQKEFKIEVIKNSLISAFNYKLIHKLSALILLDTLFKTASHDVCLSIMSSMIEIFILQLKDQDPTLRTELVKVLTNLPPEIGFANELLTAISFRFEDCQEEYEKAAISFLFSRRAVQSLPAILKTLIETKETYIAGVVFAARLGLFSESDKLLQAVFPPTPKETVAFAALQAICVMSEFKLMTESVFTASFPTLLYCLTSVTILDNMIMLKMATRALDLLPNSASGFPKVYLDTILKNINNFKYNDIIEKVSASAWQVFEQNKTIPTQLNQSQFSAIFTNLALRYLGSANFDNSRNEIVKMMSIVSSSAFQKFNDLQTQKLNSLQNQNSENETEQTVSVGDERFSFSTLILSAVPEDYADSVRTEANLLMQTKPIAVMISVSLPKISAFLPSLVRAVRESEPPDLKLVEDFIKAGMNSCGIDFIPYLRKFIEPVERSSKYFIVSIKRKTKGFIPEALNGISYACTLDNCSDYLQDLIKILDDSIESPESIVPMKNNVMNAVNSILSVCKDTKIPSSLSNKLFSEVSMSPLFTKLLKHIPESETNLLKTAILSYAKYIASNKEENTENEEFVNQIFSISDSEEILSCFLSSCLSVVSCDDPSSIIDLCLKAATTFNSSHTTNSLNFGEFVYGTSKLAISPSLPLRVLLRDCIVQLFNLTLPADTNSPLHLAGSKLSPAEVVSFASSLFDLATSKFDEDQSCKLALLAAQSRPLQFHQALFIRSLTNHAAKSIVSDNRKTLIHFLEGAEEASEEAYSLCLETAVMLFKGDNFVFTDRFLSVPLTKFGRRSLEYFVRTSEHRDNYLNAYGRVISGLKFPTTPSEQSDFLAAGYFHALYVMVNVDAASDALKQTFGQHVAHCITWLSLLLASNSTISKSLQKELIGHLTTTLDHIFARVGRSSNEPIELSLKTPKKLFLTLGTLANALMMVDFSLLVDFCRALFPLLSSAIPQIILTAGMVLARLLSRVSMLDSDASNQLLPKLRESLAYAFVKANDESCRILSGLAAETFQRSAIDLFTNEDKVKLINGSLHGLNFQGEDFRQENVTFVCKVARQTPKEYLEEYIDQVWDFAVHSRSFETMSVLCGMELKPERIPCDILAESLVAITNIDYPGHNECKEFVQAIFKTVEMKEIVSLIPSIFKDKFEEISDDVLKLVTKGNATMASLDMIVLISRGNQEKTQKVISHLIAIVDDGDHVLRDKATELLVQVISDD
ncbi:hypothetical protein TVAG_061300 [Trichomonas vaginalis G3]|uniref:Uncharacterized protein n=1 Tax=Trichomonas vaginalis (strain ATCC PRA-98 / G3) TaxID=412133 RepID=A2FYJ7_TRIV3|nr:armadillo (ARM) repeat-containing protein family [Trichomonas vaginalis G3]EAX90022.1 hypothetical protein TVAG_061300 [Trichomonas vaginalis G3]KAI5535293.1 armadillo (ARM) repeat-containing protein family [Trichomonas vaginalis G3]|eukprot:XP_001302952.1 hypothetical protein [Trichomonas vaginalis G3]